MKEKIHSELQARLAKIKLFVLDVDGTLTDGGIFIDSEGHEFKRFDAHDGHGIKLLQMNGHIEVAILSGRSSAPVVIRAKELGIKTVLQGYFEKGAALRTMIDERKLKKEEVAVMGDEVSDLEMAALAGVSFAPADAVDATKAGVDYVTARGGGHGAVREVCDMLLKAHEDAK